MAAVKFAVPLRRLGEVSGADEEFVAEAAPPLLPLCADPAHRDAEALRQAVEWWLSSLPSLGASLAYELEALGEAPLAEAFRRGRMYVAGKGDRLQGEGEEARYYTIILVGSCRLRCRAPAPKTGAVTRGSRASEDGSLAVAGGAGGAAGGAGAAGGGATDPLLELERAALEDEGFVHVGTLSRGDPLGLLPGDPRAPWDAVCNERCVVLQLGAEDYAASLKPGQKELHMQTVEFLQRYGVCPQGSAFQLQRFAHSLRRRRIRRGTVLMRAGAFQRSIFILQQGSFMLLSPPQEKGPTEAQDDMPEEEEEAMAKMESQEWEQQRFERLRTSSTGGAQRQQKAAFEAQRDAKLASLARGPLGKLCRGERGAKPHPSLGLQARKDGLVATALLSEPGAIIGEEVLLYDSFRDLMIARSCFTIHAEEDCFVYALDITGFQKLAAMVGTESIIEKTRDRMARHVTHHSACRKAANQMTVQVRRTLAREAHRQDRQTLRLPPCYAGADPVMALEDTDDWLQVVYDHRKAPKNDRCPSSLQCLEGVGIDLAKGFQTGPGATAMMEVFNRPTELKLLRSGERWRRRGPGRRAFSDGNPMGDIIQKDARYDITLPPNALSEQAQALTDDATMFSDGGGAAFFFTELDDAGGPAPPRPARAVPPPGPRSPSGASPSRSLGATGMSSRSSASSRSGALVRSSSVPALPRLQSGATSAGAAQDVVETRPGLSLGLVLSEGPTRLVSQSRKGAGTTHDAVVARAFSRAILGKSVLVLTDKVETRKGLAKAAQTNLSEFELCFVKSTTDLWARLNATKELYHILVVDLAKSELQAEPLIRTLRQHGRYSKVPVVVLSAERELSETVRNNCSFVVFQPLSASMVREAFVWCLDRKALEPQKLRAADPQATLQPSASAPMLELAGSPPFATPQLVAAAA